jgi:hypothetical protein
MDELVSITVLSRDHESEAEFAARLSRFWTHMLRSRKTDFEKVYAETTSFQMNGRRISRQYLVEADVLNVLEEEMRLADIAHEPIDADDVYSRYEAVSPEWMQIEH